MNPSEVSATSYLGEFLTFLFQTTILLAALAAAIFALGWLLWWFGRLLPRGPNERIGKLFKHIYYDIFDGAGRLLVLGSAAIALTVASAFTTWGGLTSFTEHAPNGTSTRVGLLLALAIAFGIQSVMLIAAWIIGETFAAAMPIRSGDIDSRRRSVERWIGTALGALLAIVAFVWLASALDTASPTRDEFWQRLATVGGIVAAGLSVIGIAYCFRANEFIGPYVRGLGVVVKNVVVWVMFLASLAMSVFFSFDYHFKAIFDQPRRVEMADLRAHQNFSAMTNYLGKRMPERLTEIREELVNGPALKSYLIQLGRARDISDRSPELLRQRDRADAAAQQQRVEKLKIKSETLSREIAPLAAYREQREEAETRYNEQSRKVDAAKQELTAAEAARTKEERGVSGPGLTGKPGRSTGWATANKKVQEQAGIVEAESKILRPLEEKFNNLKARPERALEPRLIELNSELNLTRAALIKEQNSELAQGDTIDPKTIRRALDDQISLFRQGPGAITLKAIQDNCVALKTIGLKVEDDSARTLDCDPKQVNEALTNYLADKTRIERFIPLCTKGENLAGKDANAMIQFAETCLQDSGLSNGELSDFYQAVRQTKIERDDKAQSFIVTVNALKERNQMAAMALAIAFTVDSLIFFAGVFAATTMTGPLQRAGLRDLARQVRQLPAKDVRWALAALRNHAFDEHQCEDPRINRIVTLGLDRQIPTEAAGTFLVRRDESGDSGKYQLHQIYRDELQELVRRAERRNEIRPEATPDRAPPDAPAATTPASEERVVVFAPRRSARGS